MRFSSIKMALLIAGLWLGLLTPAVTVQAQSDSTFLRKTPPIRGNVGEIVNGNRVPLVGASVIWVGTTSGTVTDANGVFQLPVHLSQNVLIVSYVGYQPDTITVATPSEELTVTLRAERTLQEVTVSGAPGQIDRINPIQTEFINQRTLAKAACCNLSESFGYIFNQFGNELTQRRRNVDVLVALASMMDPTSRIPLHRVGQHGELANLAAFLLSDFSAYITGESITIDGGEVLMAGEFSHLDKVTTEQWDMIEQTIRSANKTSKK